MPTSPKNKTRPWGVNRDTKGNEPRTKGMKKDMSQWYANKKWRRVRASYIQRNPLCKQCDSEGLLKGAEVVDHITPISQGGSEYALSNLQSLCKVCHDKKSRREQSTYVYTSTNYRVK